MAIDKPKKIDKNNIKNPNLELIIQEKTYDKLHSILDSMFESAVIADKDGVILRASKSFKKFYGLEVENAIGKKVADLEKQKYFRPSVIVQVIKQKKIITLTMKTKLNGYVIATGIPIYDRNRKFEGAVSFLRDAADYTNLKKQYDVLENRLRNYSAELQELREQKLGSGNIIAKSALYKRCISLALKVANVDTNLMITGESGVGKSLIAREIHRKSNRNDGPFIEINCGAIPETLLESELFGYEKGAFTGAHRDGKVGLIEMADSGTLFLDEIAELALPLQVKLLRVLQEKKLTRVGGTSETKVDFRLIAAANKDLEAYVKSGKFRNDLYYRINVVPIHIPPLRERPEDILPLIQDALYRANKEHQMDVKLSGSALRKLLSYSWPGNVREVQNMMERLVVTNDNGMISEDSVQLPQGTSPQVLWERSSTLKQAIGAVEKCIFAEAYEKYGSSVKVAKALGIAQTTAARKLRQYVPGYARAFHPVEQQMDQD